MKSVKLEAVLDVRALALAAASTGEALSDSRVRHCYRDVWRGFRVELADQDVEILASPSNFTFTVRGAAGIVHFMIGDIKDHWGEFSLECWEVTDHEDGLQVAERARDEAQDALYEALEALESLTEERDSARERCDNLEDTVMSLTEEL